MGNWNITLTPKQKLFVDATEMGVDEVFFGGAAGGGKSYVQVIDSVLYASKYPGSKQVILRRTFPELERSIIRSFLEIVPKELYTYNSSQHTVKFHNGSLLDFAFCDTENAVYNMQSVEIDCLRFDECCHFSEFQYKYLKSRVRGANDFPHLIKSCGNPGNIGHAFFRERFVEPAPPMESFDVRINSRMSETRLFIPCTVYENTFLMEKDPEYVGRLEDLPEEQRRQLLEGDWYVFSGQFFPEFKRELHVMNEMPKRTKDWRIYTTMDYGLDALAWYVIAEDTRGNAYILSEIHEPNVIISDAAKMIKQRLKELCITKVDCALAPSDLWNRRQETGRSVADIFREQGIMLYKTSRDRIDGFAATKEWLKPVTDIDGTTVSKLRIHKSCVHLIKDIPLLQYDDKRPGDASTTPHDITHSTDSLRYFCVYRSRGNKDKGEPDMYLAGADREYSRFNSTDMYNIYGKEKNGQSGTDYNPMYL